MSAPYIFADMPRDLAIALSVDERAFVQEYIVDMKPGEAIRRAGLIKTKSPTPASLLASGKRQLNKPHVRAAIHWLQSYRARNTEITAQKVLEHLWSIATADPRDVSQMRVYSCRHCFGEDFQYQWINETEFRFAHAKNDFVTDDGGYGYDPEIRPHPKCPVCKGLGEQEAQFTDSRDYTPGARALYKGVKQTRHGLEVMTHDPMRAMDMVSKILGMYDDRDRDDDQIKIVVHGGLPD